VDENAPWFKGWMETSVGRVARISTHMGFRDKLGGCSTFTSLSGVQKEMRIAVPVIILCIFTGGVALVLGKLL
jgi:hypothetical protein